MQEIFEDLIKLQRNKILSCAQRIVPHVTQEDLLQPNDYPLLEQNPHFRYEEGVLEGLLTARMAYLVSLKESFSYDDVN